MSDADSLVYLPLGGAGEIGMNLYLYGYGSGDERQWIIVDLGIGFASELPGIEVVLPDTAFIEEQRKSLLAIVLTHAHEDHYGAVAALWRRLEVPVYATAFTAELLKGRLEEHGLEDAAPVTVLKPEARFQIGPFDLEYVTMTHSIPEPNGLIIRTEAGTVLHTGDWKIDDRPVIGSPTDEARLRALGEEGCDAMVCDSTNVFRPGESISETDVANTLAGIVADAPARVIVTTFSSNVARILSLAAAARKADREVIIVGRALHRIVEAARATGFLRGDERFLSDEEFGYLPPDKVLAIVTGSQGEHRAALARIASGTHPTVSLGDGDLVVFSARTIPGNEKAVGLIENKLAARGIASIDVDQQPVHVTGHPRRGELAQMYEWVRPSLAVPMHGEIRHLMAHAEYARSLGVPNSLVVPNGMMARLAPQPAAMVDTAHAGRLLRDGELVINESDPAIRDRRRLSNTGVVFVSLVIDDRGDILIDPDVVQLGVPQANRDGVPFEDIIADAIDATLDALPRARRRDPDHLADVVRRAVRSEVGAAWGKKVECQVSVSQI